jgi:hypothetical protein
MRSASYPRSVEKKLSAGPTDTVLISLTLDDASVTPEVVFGSISHVGRESEATKVFESAQGGKYKLALVKCSKPKSGCCKYQRQTLML